MSKVAGTKQTLPSDGVALIDISRNFAADGTTPGRAVRPVKRAQLDKNLPDWHNAAATLDALHYTYDRQNPKVFYVYPPSNAVGKLEIIYGASPADATLVSTISIDDTWQTALLNYMVFRCLSKEAEAGHGGGSDRLLQRLRCACWRQEFGRDEHRPERRHEVFARHWGVRHGNH